MVIMKILGGGRARWYNAYMKDKTCPYCGSIREKAYARKTKCKDCGEQVYVRSAALDILGRSTIKASEVYVVEFWQNLKGTLGITKEHFDEAHEALKVKWGKANVAAGDVLWSLSNNFDLIQRASSNSALGQEYFAHEILMNQSHVQLMRAEYLAKVRNIDPIKNLVESKRSMLEALEIDGYTEDTVLIWAQYCCLPCEKLDNKHVSIKQEKEQQSLPQDGCRNKPDGSRFSLCICEYRQVLGDFSSYDSFTTIPEKTTKPAKKGFWGNIFS